MVTLAPGLHLDILYDFEAPLPYAGVEYEGVAGAALYDELLAAPLDMLVR